MHYFIFFQAYTNTYGELAVLKQKYEEALSHPGVVGIIVGTRPDCMPDGLLEYFADLSRHTFVLVEYGVESNGDLFETLRRVNRGHDFAASVTMLFVVRLKWVLQWSSHDDIDCRRESGDDFISCR